VIGKTELAIQDLTAVHENRHRVDAVSNPGTVPRNNKINRNKKAAKATNSTLY